MKFFIACCLGGLSLCGGLLAFIAALWLFCSDKGCCLIRFLLSEEFRFPYFSAPEQEEKES